MIERWLIAVLCIFSLVSIPSTARADTTSVNAPGWTWHNMTAYDDPSLTNSTGLAGGPSADGAYTFHGTGVILYGVTGPYVSVDGRRHRTGSVRLSIDGQTKTEVSMLHDDFDAGVNVTSVTGLPNASHDIKIEPIGGWVILTAIEVVSGDAPKAADVPDAKDGVGEKLKLGDIPTGYYRIVPATATAQTIDVKDFKTDDGTQIQLYTGNTSIKQPNQWFLFKMLTPGHYSVSPVSDATEMLSLMPGTEPHFPTNIWRNVHTDSQVWLLVPEMNGTWRLSPSYRPALCLTAGAGYSNLAAVDSEPWGNFSSQFWIITPEMPR